MKETIIKNVHRTTRFAIVVYPFVGLASAFATANIKYSTEHGYASPEIFMLWFVGIIPITIVPGIVIWCMNEFFPRMVKTTIILFLIGTILAGWAGKGVIVAMAGI